MKKSMRDMYYRILFIIASGIACSIHAESESRVTLIAGGDVEWSENTLWPRRIFFTGSGISPFKMPDNTVPETQKHYGLYAVPLYAFPILVNEESKKYAKKEYGIDIDMETEKDGYHLAIQKFPLKFDSLKSKIYYPFLKISPLIKRADISLVNLEMPLSDNGRARGNFRGSTAFAEALASAGIDVVTIANNHIMDAEEQGMFDTIDSLRNSEIFTIGAGKNLSEARKPYIHVSKGIKIAILGYTQQADGWAGDFALPERSGVMALDPFLVKEDIINAKKGGADFVVLTIHWGMENTQKVHPEIVEMGHRLIDAGADVILGHAPHVPQAVEIYNKKPILYSMGNFIFGHNHDYWMDNILANIEFSKKGIENIEIYPIAGRGKGLSQPYHLSGKPASEVLESIRSESKKLHTDIFIDNNIGRVNIK